jgi:hypothetical protein
MQVIPGLGAGGPVLVQPNPSGGVQLILRSPTPGTQATSPAQSSQQNQQQQGKSPTSHQQSMFISGAATAQLIQSTGRQQMQQVSNFSHSGMHFRCTLIIHIF